MANLNISDEILHRKKQFETFNHLFRDKNFLPQHVHIFGSSGCGKTKFTKLFFSSCEFPSVYIDCIECFGNERRLFEIILRILVGNSKKKFRTRCQNVNEFVLKMEALLDIPQNSNLIIVFDNAERMRSVKPEVFPILVRLIELTNRRSDCLSIVTISKLPWSHFSCQIGLNDTTPVQIFFPAYNKDELVDILSENCSKNICTLQILKNFVRHFVEIHHNSCIDLTELKFLIRSSLEPLNTFYEIHEGKDIKPERLWKFSDSQCRKQASEIFLRGWEENQNSNDSLDLPEKTKYVLIAAYIASYNPPKTDSKFFLKIASRNRRSIKGSKFDESKSQHLKGPKIFSLERLCFIFLQIVQLKSNFDDNIFAQVSTLCLMKLLQKCSSDQLLDNVKYKCTASFSVVNNIATTVDFDLKHYLHDFNQ